MHVSNFAVRPAKLFAEVDMNLSIFIGRRHGSAIFSSGYKRWNQDSRDMLFQNLSYVQSVADESRAAVFKVGTVADRQILDKVLHAGDNLKMFLDEKGSGRVYFHSGGRYFRKCLRRCVSSEYKELRIRQDVSDAIICLLSSTLYYWFWIVSSDCYHVTKFDVHQFPVPNSLAADQCFSAYADRLLEDLERNSEVRNRRRKDGKVVQEINYFVGKSKRIIDKIDRALAIHYGLTEEEVDYIINFDIKYRLPLA